jgi:DNA polymerase type B, organellar and viral
VVKNNLFKVFLTENKKYLIVSFLNKDFIYFRVVFNVKTCTFTLLATDKTSNNTNKTNLITPGVPVWSRTIGNTTLNLNLSDSKIESFVQIIKLDPIKYLGWDETKNQVIKRKPLSNKMTHRITAQSNPNWGVFDLETFTDQTLECKIYSRVYALGFLTKFEKRTFYLTDLFSNNREGSQQLILHCIDQMLEPKFNNFIFYVHNLGKFDVIFLHKVLIDYNYNVENKYKLEPLYRDNKIIRLTIKIKWNKNKNKNHINIKISFVDSMNLLEGSLDKLSKDYQVTTSKGIFPYLFVNKYNLNYIGPSPHISYYNEDIDKNEYYKTLSVGVGVYNWNLREETLKYLNKDLQSLFEILTKFQETL